MKTSRAENSHPRAAFSQNNCGLFFVRLVGSWSRLGFWCRLARRGLLGCTLFAGLSLRNQQHPRAAVQVHVLASGSDYRTLSGIRARRAQVQTVQAKHALAV